jgi:hypothetical protein
MGPGLMVLKTVVDGASPDGFVLLEHHLYADKGIFTHCHSCPQDGPQQLDEELSPIQVE